MRNVAKLGHLNFAGKSLRFLVAVATIALDVLEPVRKKRTHLISFQAPPPFKGCLVHFGNGIELEAVGLQFEPYRSFAQECERRWLRPERVAVTVALFLFVQYKIHLVMSASRLKLSFA